MTLCDKKRVKYVLLGQSLQRCAGVDNDAGQGSCVKQVVADDLQNDDIRCGSQKRCFKELRLTLDSHLVANLVYTFKNSKKFCKGFLCYAKGHGTMTKLSTVKVKLSDLASVTGSSQLMIVRLLHDGRQWLQPKWWVMFPVCLYTANVLTSDILISDVLTSDVLTTDVLTSDVLTSDMLTSDMLTSDMLTIYNYVCTSEV